jgi:hypothetical protein
MTYYLRKRNNVDLEILKQANLTRSNLFLKQINYIKICMKPYRTINLLFKIFQSI